jgi:hypothetical protein
VDGRESVDRRSCFEVDCAAFVWGAWWGVGVHCRGCLLRGGKLGRVCGGECVWYKEETKIAYGDIMAQRFAHREVLAGECIKSVVKYTW